MSIEWLLRNLPNPKNEAMKKASKRVHIMERSELIAGLSILAVGTIIIILILVYS